MWLTNSGSHTVFIARRIFELGLLLYEPSLRGGRPIRGNGFARRTARFAAGRGAPLRQRPVPSSYRCHVEALSGRTGHLSSVESAWWCAQSGSNLARRENSLLSGKFGGNGRETANFPGPPA